MNLQSKLAGLAAMGLSSFLAPKLAASTWKIVTGEEPPSEEQGSRFVQILVFSALSAVFVTSFQHVANNLTAKFLAENKGDELQKNTEEDKSATKG